MAFFWQYLYLFKQNRQIKTKLFGPSWHHGGNKLDAGKAKYKHVFRPCPILGNTISEKSAGFSICYIDWSQGSYSYIILTSKLKVLSEDYYKFKTNFLNNVSCKFSLHQISLLNLEGRIPSCICNEVKVFLQLQIQDFQSYKTTLYSKLNYILLHKTWL